jgi:hypothetical protein
MGNLADVSEEHAASIFSVGTYRLIFCAYVRVYITIHYFENERWRGGAWMA